MLLWLIFPSFMACEGPEKTDTGSTTDSGTSQPESTDTYIDEDLDDDGYTVDEGDCDDEDPAVNPGAVEIPQDGIDNDCSDGDAEINLELSQGDIIISEIMFAPVAASDSKGQWFELYNTTSEDKDITGLRIYNSEGEEFIVGVLSIPAQGYVSIGNGANPSTNGGVVHHFVYFEILIDHLRLHKVFYNHPTK